MSRRDGALAGTMARRLRTLGVVFCGVACCALTAAANPSAGFAVTRENVASFYRNFARLTAVPHHVPPATWLLCRLPTRGEQEEANRRMAGIHYNTRLHVYANPLASGVIDERAPVFPVGAIIVKEKFSGADMDGLKLTGIGGMIKRSPGYDPTNGDWEYFYSSDTNDFASGRLGSCIECHRSAKARDHVFSLWNSQSRR